MSDMAKIMRERRDKALEAQARHPSQIGSPFITKVVGVSFVPGYPDNMHNLAAVQGRAESSGEPLAVVLVRKPDNEYDANAIEVHIPALGEKWGFIGHLTRPIAARIAPEMDSDVMWYADVVSVLIDPEHMDRPGISIRCARAPEESKT